MRAANVSLTTVVTDDNESAILSLLRAIPKETTKT
jgi:hypothetical protein